jgi:hypothetical protein
MPAFYFKCDKCSKQKRKILPKLEKEVRCECGGVCVRAESNTSSVVKEVLDNGIMARKVERIYNIQELAKERSKDPDDPGIV